MSGHYLHLLSNHFPIILALVGFAILTVGMLKHDALIKKTALLIFLAASLFTIPAYISGEEAEHAVEHYPSVSESQIEEHEEIAEKVILFCDALGLFALAALLLMRKQNTWSIWSMRAVWIIALLSIIGLFFVNQSGGKIRRPELRNESNSIEHSDQ